MSLRVNHEDEVENITRWRDERCRRASRAASLARAAVLKRVQRSAVTGDADGGRPPIVDKRAHTATGSVASDTVSELCDRLQSYQEIICRQRRVIERCEEECSVWRTRHYDLQHAYDRLLATHRPRTETLPRCSSPSPRFNAVAASFSSLHDVLNEYRAQSSDARACSNDCESDLKLLLTDISRLQDVVVTLGMWRKSVVPIVGNLVMALISAWTLLAAERRTVSELVDLSKEQARTIASLEREVTAARVSLCVCAMLSIIANEVRDASSIVISVQSCTLSRQTTCIKTLEDALHQKAQDIESLQDEFCKARHILSSSCSHLERRCDVITWHNRVLLETSKRSFVEQALTRSWISRFASNLHSLNDHHRTQLQPGSPIYGKPVKLSMDVVDHHDHVCSHDPPARRLIDAISEIGEMRFTISKQHEAIGMLEAEVQRWQRLALCKHCTCGSSTRCVDVFHTEVVRQAMKLASDAQQVASRSRMEFQALCKRQLETDAKVAELRQLVAASRIRQWDLSMCLADLTSNLHYGTLSRALSESIYRERAAQRKFVDHVQCCAKTFGDNERIIEALNQYVARSLLLAARFSASAAYFRAELASTCRTLSVQSLQLQNLETELRFRAVSRRFDEPDVCVLSRHAGHLVRIVSRMTFSYESTGEVMRSRLGQALLLAAEVGSLAAGERLQRSEVLTRAAELVRCCHALESEVAVWQSKTRCPEHEDLPSNLLSSNFLGLIGSVDVPPTNDDALTPLANLQFQLVSSLESEVHSWRRRYWDVVSCHADNTDDRAPASAVLGPWNDLRRAELRLCPVPLQVAETDSGDQLSNLHASLEGSKGTAAYLVNDLRFALGHLDSVSRRLHTVRKSNSQGIGNLGRAIKAIVHLLGRSAEWESTWGAFLAQLGVRLATLEGSIKQLHVHLYGLTNSHSRMSVRLHRATNEVVFLRARLSALSDKHDQDARQASSQYEEELAGVHDKYHNQVQETEEALRQLSHLKSRCEKLRHENGSLRLERQALLCDNHDITESLETAKARILELDSTIAAYTLKETTDMQENLHVIQALKYEKRQVQTSLELCREEVEEKRAESSALLQTIQALQVECTRHRAQVQLNEQAPRAEKLLSMASGLKHVLNLCKELREQIAEIRDETNSLANMRCQEFKRVEREIALRIDTYRSQAEIKLDSKDDELATERRRFNALLAMRRFSTGTQK